MKITPSELERLSEAKTFPDKTPYKSLSVANVLSLAGRSAVSGREIEIAALENGIVPERYARNMRSFSLADQAALLGARVGVVGLGGLGGTVAEVLGRMGVGRLTLVDGDRFEDSNLNRQLLSTVEGLGQLKSEAARARVGRINPSVDVTALTEFVTRGKCGGRARGLQCRRRLPRQSAHPLRGRRCLPPHRLPARLRGRGGCLRPRHHHFP